MSHVVITAQQVKAALDAVNGIEEVQGNPPDHVDLLYYRSQEHYDRYGRDKGDYAIVNARSREIAAILEAQGIEARFRYPEDDEAALPTFGEHSLNAFVVNRAIVDHSDVA